MIRALATLIVRLLFNVCRPPGVMGCDHALQDCANEANSTLCGCRGDYTTCLIRMECDDEVVDSFIADCQRSGCTEMEVVAAFPIICMNVSVILSGECACSVLGTRKTRLEWTRQFVTHGCWGAVGMRWPSATPATLTLRANATWLISVV
jgi:hypothetical protein